VCGVFVAVSLLPRGIAKIFLLHFQKACLSMVVLLPVVHTDAIFVCSAVIYFSHIRVQMWMVNLLGSVRK
jgi:hypothetical protein